MGWGGVGMLTFLQSRSFDLQQDVYSTDVDARLAWGWVGWGGVGMLTFLQPRSFDLEQNVYSTDVDATLTWGGVGVTWECV